MKAVQGNKFPVAESGMKNKKEEYRLLFVLSPNDLVYVPTENELNIAIAIDNFSQ